MLGTLREEKQNVTVDDSNHKEIFDICHSLVANSTLIERFPGSVIM